MINPAIVRYQRLSIWCGVLFTLLFFVALMMVGLIPPPSPMLSGDELIATHRDRVGWIKAAMPVAILAAGLSIPWNAVITGHIARIEAKDGGMHEPPFLPYGGVYVGHEGFKKAFGSVVERLDLSRLKIERKAAQNDRAIAVVRIPARTGGDLAWIVMTSNWLARLFMQMVATITPFSSGLAFLQPPTRSGDGSRSRAPTVHKTSHPVHTSRAVASRDEPQKR